MKLLVIGSGGREHALAWRLAQGARVQKVFVAPGNAGSAGEPGVENIDITELDKLADFAIAEQIHLTVVGPEAPLAAGVVDMFRGRGLNIFGPTQAAAQLESSKEFAKRFMQRHNIPTAQFQSFIDAAAAHAYVAGKAAPIVIKADGLAAGKGVVVAQTLDEAHAAIDMMLRDQAMGSAGARVVIEDFLEGEEASFIVVVDGEHVLPLATSQDHKRLQDGDLGPNTGGMGAYSPAPVVTPAIHARILREVILPTVAGMAAEGIPYSGFLYAGLMIDKAAAPHVVEFNCRLGDPETQPIMMRLKSDLFEILEHAMAGTLDKIEAEWDRRVALGIVYAAANYPGKPRTGDVIEDLPANVDDAHVFHAATALKGGKLVTSGGRVLCAAALGDSVKMAQRRAYQYAEPIRFAGMQLRRDIGHRGVPARKG
jgi:phosphoribosylamine--glycine ligase